MISSRQQRRALAALAVAALLAPGARADEPSGAPGGREAPAPADRTTLVSLTPPVTSYSSFEGVEYNAAPFSCERALSGRLGLRLSSSVVVHDRVVERYGVVLAAPAYLGAGGDRPSRGPYATPLVAAFVDRLAARAVVRAGGEAGWAWSFAERWRFAAGVWALVDGDRGARRDGGLTLAFGLWM